MRKTTGVGAAIIAIGLCIGLTGLIQQASELEQVPSGETGLTIWDWALGAIAAGVILLILDWLRHRRL